MLVSYPLILNAFALTSQIRLPVNFWDKGPDALRAFIKHHNCNSLCDFLELDDLNDFDIDEIVKCAQADKGMETSQTPNSDERMQHDNDSGDTGSSTRQGQVN